MLLSFLHEGNKIAVGGSVTLVFLCSANAITKNGEIYQVDGLSNRIAPLVYDLDCVIIVADCSCHCKTKRKNK